MLYRSPKLGTAEWVDTVDQPVTNVVGNGPLLDDAFDLLRSWNALYGIEKPGIVRYPNIIHSFNVFLVGSRISRTPNAAATHSCPPVWRD